MMRSINPREQEKKNPSIFIYIPFCCKCIYYTFRNRHRQKKEYWKIHETFHLNESVQLKGNWKNINHMVVTVEKWKMYIAHCSTWVEEKEQAVQIVKHSDWMWWLKSIRYRTAPSECGNLKLTSCFARLAASPRTGLWLSDDISVSFRITHSVISLRDRRRAVQCSEFDSSRFLRVEKEGINSSKRRNELRK